MSGARVRRKNEGNSASTSSEIYRGENALLNLNTAREYFYTLHECVREVAYSARR
jgi:hypothetical protein